jgi:hypothetical protein
MNRADLSAELRIPTAEKSGLGALETRYRIYTRMDLTGFIRGWTWRERIWAPRLIGLDIKPAGMLMPKCRAFRPTIIRSAPSTGTLMSEDPTAALFSLKEV